MDIEKLYWIVDKYGEHGLQADTVDEVLKVIEKQIPKPPEYKVVEKYKALGKNYWCECGVMFVDFERNGTNFCGNCGRRLKGAE
jgi:hypothetical protein